MSDNWKGDVLLEEEMTPSKEKRWWRENPDGTFTAMKNDKEAYHKEKDNSSQRVNEKSGQLLKSTNNVKISNTEGFRLDKKIECLTTEEKLALGIDVLKEEFCYIKVNNIKKALKLLKDDLKDTWKYFEDVYEEINGLIKKHFGDLADD